MWVTPEGRERHEASEPVSAVVDLLSLLTSYTETAEEGDDYVLISFPPLHTI
jgi:hypothetical protein